VAVVDQTAAPGTLEPQTGERPAFEIVPLRGLPFLLLGTFTSDVPALVGCTVVLIERAVPS